MGIKKRKGDENGCVPCASVPKGIQDRGRKTKGLLIFINTMIFPER